MNEQFKFNADELINQVNNKKEAIMADLGDEKELPPNIEEYPESFIDLLVERCNPKNLEKTIEKLKGVLEKRPQLTEYLLNQIQSQTKINQSSAEKYDSIEDQEKKAFAKAKWIDKNRSLVNLVKAISGGGNNQNEEE